MRSLTSRCIRQRILSVGTIAVAAASILIGVAPTHAAELTDSPIVDIAPSGVECTLQYRDSTGWGGGVEARAECASLPAGINVRVGVNNGPDTVWSQSGALESEWSSWGMSRKEAHKLQYRADPTGFGSNCAAVHQKIDKPWAADDHSVRLSCSNLAPSVKARGLLKFKDGSVLLTSWQTQPGSIESDMVTGGATGDTAVEYYITQ